MEDNFNLVIVGGGSAAFAAAIKAAELKVKVAIVEQGVIGGTCLNRGCIPTKSLLRAGEIFYYSQHSGYKGLHLKGKVNLPEIIKQKDSLVRELRQRKYMDIIKAIPEIELIRGRAEFVSSNEIMVGKKRVGADKFVIAAGAHPAVLDIPGIEKVPYLTSTEALSLTKLPRSITILGGRFVALEFAQIFRHLGSKVTILQRSPRIIPDEEDEISEEMKKILTDEGIDVWTGATILGVESFKARIYIHAKINGKEKRIPSDALLMATGIKANTELNLDSVGVKLNEKGFIIVDDTMKTTAENIWAAGDVTGRMPLVTVAAHQGAIAGENAISNAQKTIDYSIVPHAVFTSPQIASVGLTDREAVRKGYRCDCRKLSMEYVPRAKAVHDDRGLIKMVADRETGGVLGVHILAPEASEVIHQAALILKNKMTLHDVIEKIDVYPTMSEMIKLCAQSYFKDIGMLSCCAE